MIAQLTGKVIELESKAVIVDVGGIGYRVRIPAAVEGVTAVGQVLTLRTYHHVTEDAQALFGFASKEDLRFFELLLTVPSVGPKTAMNILDVAPPKTLAQAVANGDIKLLTKVSGIGRKTAERIMVELKNKFKDVPITGIVGDVHEETFSVLLNMGYSRAQAREIVQNLPANIGSVEEAVKVALKQR